MRVNVGAGKKKLFRVIRKYLIKAYVFNKIRLPIKIDLSILIIYFSVA
jgi:hypothetical protein